MFNTIRGKRIAILGFSFKKDTGDVRESPAIDVCKGLLDDGAQLSIYDPKVSEASIRTQLALEDFEWDHPCIKQKRKRDVDGNIACKESVYDACKGAHAICVLTEWDEFRAIDLQGIFGTMMKPAFLFDGRNVINHELAKQIGFVLYALGKPLDPFLTSVNGS